jgi:hypothetical protein
MMRMLAWSMEERIKQNGRARKACFDVSARIIGPARV